MKNRRGKLLLVLGLVLSTAAIIYFRIRRPAEPAAVHPPGIREVITRDRVSPEVAAEFLRLEAHEAKLRETAWAPEILGQQCGRTFEVLWDSINATTNKLRVAGTSHAEEIVFGKWERTNALPHGIEIRESAGAGQRMSRPEWVFFIEGLIRDDWQLLATEFRHNRFETNSTGGPDRSVFFFAAHLANNSKRQRCTVEGDLVVHWGVQTAADDLTPVKRIDASGLTLKLRTGEVPFQLVLSDEVVPPENSRVIDPLIVQDLNKDGFSEVILAAKNLIYTQHDSFRLEPETFCRIPESFISTALIADFDSDGIPDFLCQKYEGVFLFSGSRSGTFIDRARKVWTPPAGLDYGIVLTCGDIDCDEDLDIFVAQYKEPYEGGTTPQPFFDANDGHPAYLLLNDGKGNFSDATLAAGLGAKRWRRSYSASFADLDGDRFLDLLVVSDFAGVDLYKNNGEGKFIDVTRSWVTENHAFGMAHTLADFNIDGRIDFLMTGMTSPAVERLNHLGLSRTDVQEDRSMLTRMTQGNRLYIARSDASGFEENALSQNLARSGWSWGCAAFDFDNDSYPDVYIANGLESNASVRDYEAEYWLHDRFLAQPRDQAAASLYFKSKFTRTRGNDYSYGGYEKNRLFLNQQATNFIEAGSLLGVAIEEDSRNVVADDLDGDGRVDLIVTTLEIWPRARQTLHIYKNNLVTSNNWIGFRFHEGASGGTLIGTSVTLKWNGNTAVRHIVSGDSYRSQHPTAVHFGLGKLAAVENVQIRWPNGQIHTIEDPKVNRYHWVEKERAALRDAAR